MPNITLVLGDSNAANGSPSWPTRLAALRTDLGSVGVNALTGRTALDAFVTTNGVTLIDGQLAFAGGSGTIKNHITALGTNYNQSPLDTALTLRRIAASVVAFGQADNVGYPITAWIATIAPKLVSGPAADHGRQTNRYLYEMAASPGAPFKILEVRDIFARDPACLSELTSGDKVHFGALSREAIAQLCAAVL